MINVGTGGVYGHHRRKAQMAGTMWSIHWKHGHISTPMTTNETYEVTKGKVADILFIENISMRDYLSLCLEQVERGMVFSVFNGSLSYIEEDYYIEKDSIGRRVDKLTARRELQIYYTLEPEELVGDQSYIEAKVMEML
jgi:hypothetical protein